MGVCHSEQRDTLSPAVSQSQAAELLCPDNLVSVFVLASFTCFLFLWLFRSEPGPIHPQGYQNLSYAYNLVVNGTFCSEKGPNARIDPNEYRPPLDGTPSAWREPGYAFVAGAVLLALDWSGLAAAGDFFHGDAVNKRHMAIKALQGLHIACWAMVCGICSVAAWMLSRSLPVTVAAAVCTHLATLECPLVFDNMFVLGFAENLTTLFMAALALFIGLFIRKQLVYLLFAAGLTLGALALTSALWLTSIPLFALFIGFAKAHRPGLLYRLGLASLFLVTATAMPALWIARNYVQFHRPGLCFKGGMVIDVRSRMDRMTFDEYKASYLYWSGSKKLARFARKTFDTEKLDTYGPTTFFQEAVDRRNELDVLTGRNSVSDKLQTQEAFELIRKHLPMHFALIPPMLIRGLSGAPFPWGLILFGITAAAFIASVRRKRVDILALLLPAAVLVMFQLCLSHNLPRYYSPLYPTLITSAVVVCFALFGGRMVKPANRNV